MAAGKRAGKAAAGLMALALLAIPAGGAASESAPGGVSDAQLFTREFREKGALRFYETAEEELRLGRFEAAFLRYRFLTARVGGDPAYLPLAAMAEHRLRFLAGQMGLMGVEVPPLRAVRSRQAHRAPALRSSPDPAPDPATLPEKARPAAAPTPETPVPPPATPAARVTASPPPGPPAPDRPSPAEPAPQEPERAEQKPPAEPRAPSPPPTRWQRLKERLFFWRK
ncbi:MAG: hypothetical protein K6T55_03750 [Syntrophobacterales bacterium]|nr:hypothetical protein [Syntrophobacterales bacterium]